MSDPERRHPLRPLPFTAGLLAAMIAVAVVTGSHLGPLTERWLHRLGFASADLWLLDLERLVTSGLATWGSGVFWRALVLVALLVGSAEWWAGTGRTAAVFVGGHVLTLVLLALLVRVGLRGWHPPLADALHAARDVGPSAGYFACLALLCRMLPRRVRRPVVGAVGLGLAAALSLVASDAASAPADVSAALAHAIAFPLGWLLSAGAGSRA